MYWNVFKAIAIFFVGKESCSSSRIDLLLPSVKANVLFEKIAQMSWASAKLVRLQLF